MQYTDKLLFIKRLKRIRADINWERDFEFSRWMDC